MSEVRSWDRWVDKRDGAPFLKELTQSRVYPSQLAVRVVAWPEGAPKQEDVPHVGEVRKWKEENYTVLDGIPFKNRNKGHVWSLHCNSDLGSSWFIPVGDLEPISPTPPQTYTEEEIREAIKGAIDLGTHYEDLVMKTLQKP